MPFRKKKPFTSSSALMLISSVIATSASAQAISEDDIEIIKVQAQALKGLGMSPKDALIDGPFGDGVALKDIPRSLTVISSDMIEQLNISTLQDLSKISPNAYSASGFGAPSLPTLRGQLGELFQDGIRRQAGNNGFGVPLSFNAIDQIDVFKGAPPVLLGSSQRNGGFVNLRSKQASVTEQNSQLSLSAGRWDNYKAQLDYSTVLQERKQGLRVSVEHINSGSFYDYSQHQSDNVYFAYKLKPDNQSTWDVNLEYYHVDYTDNAGINRPTQALIDNNLYITGQGVQANGSFVPRAGSVISPTGQVVIARSGVLTDPDNINNATTYLLHSIYKRQINENTSIKNTSYLQYLEREEIAQNSFVEIIDGATTAQNRIELSQRWSPSHSSIFAFDIRYNDVLGYSQFTTEADAPIDLTGPIENRRIPLDSAQQARLVELRPGVFVSPGAQYDVDGDGVGDFSLSDTTDSSAWQTGFVAQHNSQWTDKFNSSLGYRIDFYEVEARDAIAPQGQIAARDSISEALHSAQISLGYNFSQQWVSYATASYNEATSNSMAGGTVLGANNLISAQNFATENTLFEIGLKYSPINSQWYADGALFNQVRSLRNRDGSNTGIRAQGIELQVFFASDEWWFNAGYSYIDAQYDNSETSQETAQVADAFDASRSDIIVGTGIGSPSFTVFAASNQQVQGIPEQSLSINAGYSMSADWQVGFSSQYTKSYPLDYLATVFIRDQISINLYSSYALNPQTQLRFDVNNITNEENWRPVFEGGFFGSTLAFPEQPINAELSLTYTF